MSFAPFTLMQPGDQFTVRTSAQGPAFLPGTKGLMPNGDIYRYGQAGAVAVVVGKLYQAAIPIANHVLQTAAAAPVGQTYVDLTLGATAAVANDYLNGTLVVDLASNTGFGYIYSIGAHAAVASAGVFRVPFAGSERQVVQSDGLILAGTESVQVAIATTANSVSVYRNPYKQVILSIAATPPLSAQVAGFSVKPIAIGGWGWFKTRGEVMALTNGTVVIGATVVPSATTAGAVEAYPAGTAETNTGGVGWVSRVATTTNYSTVYATID